MIENNDKNIKIWNRNGKYILDEIVFLQTSTHVCAKISNWNKYTYVIYKQVYKCL